MNMNISVPKTNRPSFSVAGDKVSQLFTADCPVMMIYRVKATAS